MFALLTGSQVYGAPRPDSDVDLVVLADDETIRALIPHADGAKVTSETARSASLRFGKLNLVCVGSTELFEKWRAATAVCIGRSDDRGNQPITRAEAMEIFKALGV
jgi:hypothetical protein